MNNITSVQSGLDNFTASITGVPEIQVENKRYKPDLRTNWARTTLLPSETYKESQSIYGYNVLNGVYQVDLFFTAGRTEINSCNELADTVVDAYVKQLFIASDDIQIRIINSWRDLAITESDWYRLPVFIRWESHQQRNTIN